MPAVKSFNHKSDPSWDEVNSYITELEKTPRDRGVTLSVDDDNWAVGHYCDGYGFLVTICTDQDKDYLTLRDPSLYFDHVSVWCGGSEMTRPRNSFVKRSLATQALKYFFDEGRKDPSLVWRSEED